MRIAIVGAGIAGLVTAAGIQADGHEVAVFERRDEPNPVGAGLTLFNNAFAALDLLGLGDSIRQISRDGIVSGAIAAMRPTRNGPKVSWLLSVPSSATATMRSVHRVALHRELMAQLAPGTVRTGSAALVAADGTPQVTASGRTEQFDLVVVADGLRSRNREILGLDTGLRYAGYTAWRGVTEQPVSFAVQPGEIWGRGQVFGMVPLPDARVYWYATRNTAEGQRVDNEYELVREEFSGWHETVQECIAVTAPDAVMRHDIYDLAKPLTSFVRGRTVLLGDAAHAMTPNLGQGAGQGIEDAATLTCLLRDAGGRMLRDASGEALDAALAKYSQLRQKRTSSVLRRSRSAGLMAQAEHPAAVGFRNALTRLMPPQVMSAMTQRLQQWPKPEL
ncbi:FAD-dependent monooxygenase [Gulosibacter sp. GYB002]|uniref:FAD-dependent monooxygenase n=1 Tax=Gulosibacter sp. GYB002 TaxID=2994391 RepID=UPI002F963447